MAWLGTMNSMLWNMIWKNRKLTISPLLLGLLIIFKKRLLNNRFLLRFSIVFKNDSFVFGKSQRFYKQPTCFELLKKEL